MSSIAAFGKAKWARGASAYTEHEFCHLLAGCVRLIGDDASEITLWAGDSFVIPAGFEGVWEVLEPARKLYAVYEPQT